MGEFYTEQKHCRFCNSKDLNEIISLGGIYPSDFVDSGERTEKVPLTLVQCSSCNLVQLAHTVDLDAMYRKYWYRSALNNSMVESLRDVVRYANNYLEPHDITVDIGCNDCTMLDMYGSQIATVGFDPAENLESPARERCNFFFNDYFTAENYAKTKLPRAKVVTAIAMFYDLPDVNVFVQDVEKILADDGVFIVQYTDLISMLRINAVDNLCHEHLEYYSLEVMNNIMWVNAGLVPINVSYNDVNGGSIRVTYSRVGVYPVDPSVERAIIFEREYFNNNTLENFADVAHRIRFGFVRYMKGYVRMGNKIAVLGASTKGNTLLQFYGLDKSIISHCAEINPDKFGKVTIGTEIPIISERESLAQKPDAYIVLPWHFIDNFIEKNKKYLMEGGRLIVPLPEPKVYFFVEGELQYYDIPY